MFDNNFLGKNNFIWFNGVVEDSKTTETWQTTSVVWVFIQIIKMILPTSDLPWSQLIHPITSSGISGLGSSPGFIVEGTWVFGYFRDGYAMQEPMRGNRNFTVNLLNLADVNKGFYDPNGVYPKYKDEVDTNRLAVNDSNNPHLDLELRKLTRKDMYGTDFDAVPVEEHISTAIEASDSDTWDQLYNTVQCAFIHLIMYLNLKVVTSLK